MKTCNFLSYHANKLARRFDAATCLLLTQAMDTHDLAGDCGGYYAALPSLPITTPALEVGIVSDGLCLLAEQQELAVPNSLHGNDVFLIETDRSNQLILEFHAMCISPTHIS